MIYRIATCACGKHIRQRGYNTISGLNDGDIEAYGVRCACGRFMRTDYVCNLCGIATKKARTLCACGQPEPKDRKADYTRDYVWHCNHELAKRDRARRESIFGLAPSDWQLILWLAYVCLGLCVCLGLFR